MKVVSKDAMLAALKDRLIRAQNKGDQRDIDLTTAVREIIRLMPETEVQDGICCEECFFYDAASKRCCHRNGLQGRIRKGMFCSYGSPSYADTQTDIDDSAFAEFDEVEDEQG